MARRMVTFEADTLVGLEVLVNDFFDKHGKYIKICNTCYSASTYMYDGDEWENKKILDNYSAAIFYQEKKPLWKRLLGIR